MISNFKSEIKHLNKKFSPKKTYKILKNNEKGKLIAFPLYGESFLCRSENNYFEIKYNENILKKDIFDESKFSHEDMQDIFNYFARHEFGHSKFPKIDHIFEETDFPNLSTQKHCYVLLGIFKEFCADRFVDKNFDEVPNKYIEQWAMSLSVNREIFKSSEFLENISRYLQKNLYIAERFFIFKKWDLLRDFYHNNNLDLLYELLFKIFEKFMELCIDQLDLIFLRQELFKLAKKLNEIDYNILLKIRKLIFTYI